MHKLIVIIGKLIDILFQLENNFLASKIPEKIKAVKKSKNCQACKYRLAFYNQDAKIPDHF